NGEWKVANPKKEKWVSSPNGFIKVRDRSCGDMVNRWWFLTMAMMVGKSPKLLAFTSLMMKVNRSESASLLAMNSQTMSWKRRTTCTSHHPNLGLVLLALNWSLELNFRTFKAQLV